LINNNYYIISAEITKTSESLSTIEKIDIDNRNNIGLIVGNEVTGILKETLEYSHRIIHIPMI
jgi:tRNA G18 (ribose-2'-O)-methylase SpoU